MTKYPASFHFLYQIRSYHVNTPEKEMRILKVAVYHETLFWSSSIYVFDADDSHLLKVY